MVENSHQRNWAKVLKIELHAIEPIPIIILLASALHNCGHMWMMCITANRFST